ncbi:MAG: hypothetical protein AABX16_00915 [Nanoarchaeota archaeon]
MTLSIQKISAESTDEVVDEAAKKPIPFGRVGGKENNDIKKFL